MPFFPIEKWFRDLGTFVEHSHRQFGLVIGLFMLAALVPAFFGRSRRRPARWLVLLATLAVCIQGWLGGSRVLEDSPEFAFLHGAFAQLVFGLILAAALVYSKGWLDYRAEREPKATDAAPNPVADLRALRTATRVVTGLVYLQILLGAFYRHGLRNGLHSDTALNAVFSGHLFGGMIVFFAIMVLAAHLLRAQSVLEGPTENGEPDPKSPLARLRKRLVALLFAQVFLGASAWMTFDPGSVPFAEWAFATAHVLVGALLFATTLQTALWASRLTRGLSTAGNGNEREAGAPVTGGAQ